VVVIKPIELSEEDAQTRLTEMTASDKEPTLSEGELTGLLEQSKRKDSTGREPTNDSWTPTWLLEYGAWRGWEIKANRLSSSTTFLNDGRAQGSDYSWLNAVRLRDYYRSLVDASTDVSDVPSLPGSVVFTTRLSW
jgi:hypothetical protein